MSDGTTGIRIEIESAAGQQPAGAVRPPAAPNAVRNTSPRETVVDLAGLPEGHSFEQLMKHINQQLDGQRKRLAQRVRIPSRSRSGNYERGLADDEEDRAAEERGRDKAQSRQQFLANLKQQEFKKLQREASKAANSAAKALTKKSHQEHRDRQKQAHKDAKDNHLLNHPRAPKGKRGTSKSWGGLRYSLGSYLGGYIGSRAGYKFGGHLGGLAGMYGGRRLGLKAQGAIGRAFSGGGAGGAARGIGALGVAAGVAAAAVVGFVAAHQKAQGVLLEEADKVKKFSPALKLQEITEKLRDMGTDFDLANRFGDRMAEIKDRESRSKDADRRIVANISGWFDNLTKGFMDPIAETWVQIKEYIAGTHDVNEENRKFLEEIAGYSKKQLEEMGIKGDKQNQIATALKIAEHVQKSLGGQGIRAFQGAAKNDNLVQQAVDGADIAGPDAPGWLLIAPHDDFKEMVR